MKRLLMILSVFFLVMGSHTLAARESSGSEIFWCGDDDIPIVAELPPVNGEIPLAQLLHGFLAGDVQAGWLGVLSILMNSINNFDNRNGDEGVTIYNPEMSWYGYTLLSAPHITPEGENHSILIDMQGNIINEWPLYGFPAKMLPNGNVMGGIKGGDPDSQDLTELVQMDWCGNQVWSWTGFGGEGGARWHHDYQREGNPVGYFSPYQLPLLQDGKTLILAHYFPTLAETCPDPINDRNNCISEMELQDDVIYEVDWEGNIIWQWHAYEHYHQMGFDESAREAIRTIHAPTGGCDITKTDWQHTNAISYLGPNIWYLKMGDERFHPDNIIWDGRSSNITAIIARHDHPLGDWQSGDIVWKIGPDFSPGKDEHKLGQIIGQHMAHMIPINLPGGGNILLFDNGGYAGFGSLLPGLPPHFPNKLRDYSRVIEFDPRTFEIVWKYENKNPLDGERKFFSSFISGAQRLPNSNTLITEGVRGRVFEVTPQGEIVWEFISPFGAVPVDGCTNANSQALLPLASPIESQEQGSANTVYPVYRAYRVPPWWLPENLDCTGQ
ncbi:hypothetical protein SCALIN_C01_0138 [Candidatus Scalindua japonica]|uniref:Thioredoxin n=1 Tax=Candidatus Scalindua japonica TaxID=1284222 RepID=A0A286TTK3_9BACT|nr:aryl-sulfate sulfotransferase [Candidatus Scalindua japonica]GAX59207.1 hypothetical protein SCALIN_C01_0138 [Candidatus Scalindua japonica]